MGVNKINITQLGRSMIEMLGVLAVIGVLSVAGIAGYSKAIDRYKVNETINQITYIVQNTRDLFKTQPDLYGSMSFESSAMSNTTYPNRQIADKAKIFPESVIKNGYKNLYGGDIRFMASGRFSNNDGKAFLLGFINIPQEACIELSTKDWQALGGLVAIKIIWNGVSDDLPAISTFMYGCSTQTSQTQKSIVACSKDVPISVEQAVDICKSEYNSITWKFY